MELEYLSARCLESLADVSEQDRSRLADLILSHKRIFIFGVGRSGLVGQMFAIRLVQLGLTVYFVGDMSTPILEKDDLLILVSNTGKTVSVVKTAEIAKRIGTHVVSVTSDGKSNLVRNSDSVLIVRPDNSADSGRIAPLGTIFEDATLLFFDSMVPKLMDRLGSTEDDMRKKHAIWV